MQYISQKHLFDTAQTISLIENSLLCEDKQDKFLMNYAEINFIKLCALRGAIWWLRNQRVYYCEVYNIHNQCITIYETSHDYPKTSYEDFIKALHLQCNQPNFSCEYHSDQPRISGWIWFLLFIAWLFMKPSWFSSDVHFILLLSLVVIWRLTAVFFVRGVKPYKPKQIPSFMFPY